MKISRDDIKIMTESCLRMLTEISSKDAYTRFYSKLATPEQWEDFMYGAPTMTPIHKAALDAMTLDGNEWDAELAAIVKKAWTTMDGDGRIYAIDMIKNAQEYNKAYITSVSGLKQTLVKAMSLPYHTEAKFCENGLVKLYEDDTILVTCTTSYSASKKYYGDTHWCTASDIAGRYDGFQKFVEYTTEEEDACLVQFVPKADRTKAIQAQFYDDGWAESVCDFYDKTKEVEDIVALFDNEKTGYDVIKYKIPYSDLCRETEKAVDNESDYWNSRSKSFFEKQKKAFSDEITNGGYDSLLINAIIEYEGKKTPPSEKWVFTDGNDRWEMSTYEVVGYFDGYAVFNTELLGLSDLQKAFIGRLFDDSDEAAEEYTNYIFTISTEGGKVTKSSRVLSRFKGTAYSDAIINGIAEIKYYSYRYDAEYRQLVNLKNGKTILNEVFQVYFYDGKVFFQKNYEEFEDSVWHVLDPSTGKYLGKSKGYLENIRKEFSSGKMMSESKSLLSELDENDVIDLTPQWMSAEYDRMNAAYFDGKLGECSFGLFTTGKGSEGGVLGWFKISGTGIYVSRSSRRMFTKNVWGDKDYITRENFASLCKPRIELNGNYRWSRKAALSTLVHEMCHYYCNMNGWRPAQHHGPEFMRIASYVSMKSGEFFTVQRVAKAEQMTEMELNSIFAEKKKRRADAKAAKIIVVVVYKKNGEVRLVNASNWNLVGEIEQIERSKCRKLLVSQDPELIAYLFENKYRSTMRTYRYWDITGKPIEKELGKYQFTTRIDNNVMEVRANDIKKMVSECLSLILEKNTPVLYHFLCADSLIHVLKTNRFDLNDCGDGTYYMSTTRNRNSVQGYPYMQSDYSMGGGTYHNPGNEGMLIRLELDGELLSAYGKIQPYDYLYDTGDACDINMGPLNGIQDAMTYKDCPEEMYHQPFSQGEDRLVSRKKSIPNADRIIRKIDMYIDPYKAGDKHWQDMYGKKLTYLIKNYKDKINFYDDRNKFDRQV